MPRAAIMALIFLCLALGLYFWFRRVHRVMKARQEAVEIARKQRQEVRRTAAPCQAEAYAAVVERSESIYHQAVVLYIQALDAPLNWLPAAIMGYHPLSENDN